MNRIELLASLCKGSKVICDIGCDHAYVIVQAIEKYGVAQALAVDIAQGPLQNAYQNILRHNLESQVQCICSDGFKRVPLDCFDTVILSGMGGLLIMDILRPYLAMLKDKKMILGAHSDVRLLRQFLFEHGFSISFEQAIIDKDIYYEIMVAEYKSTFYDEYDMDYGPILRRNQSSEFRKHYEKRSALIDQILKNLNTEGRKEELQMESRQIKEVLNLPVVEKKYILNTKNYYRTYFLDDTQRPTIIVSPGGGYQYTSPRESEPVVERFSKLGYHVVVVNYRETNEESYPKPGTYLATAIDEVASDKRVGKVIGLGFSAGGHCLLEVILHASDYHLKTQFAGLMLGYPVITADAKYAHMGSFEKLLKEQKDHEDLRKYLSLETQVRKDNAPKLFLWGTFTDESVSVMNSLLLLEAYKRVQASVEYHCFPFGGHAMSVANEYSAEGNEAKVSPYIAKWVDLAADWLKKF